MTTCVEIVVVAEPPTPVGLAVDIAPPGPVGLAVAVAPPGSVAVVTDIAPPGPVDLDIDVYPPGPVDLAISAGIIVIGGAGSSTVVHHQSVASTLWIINHNLGRRVAVEITDLGGTEMVGDVTAPSLNQTRVSFKSAQTGYAIIN